MNLSCKSEEITAKDRRSDPRSMTNGKGLVTALGAPTYGTYATTIVDVSRSGLQLELGTPLQKGIQVKVEFRDLIVIGEVLNLRSHSVGRYRVGVLIREVAESHGTTSLRALDKVLTEGKSNAVIAARDNCGAAAVMPSKSRRVPSASHSGAVQEMVPSAPVPHPINTR